MKPLLLLLFIALLGSTGAVCTSDDGPCQPGSGSCTEAVTLGFPPNSDLPAAIDALTYGKYCGGSNSCRAVAGADPSNDQQCEINVFGCPPEPCDEIDTACAVRNACLDQYIAENPDTSVPIPVPERCRCDVKYTADLALAVLSGEITGLCDASFYEETAGGFINVFQHEGVLLAAPYCCDVVSAPEEGGEAFCAVDAQENGYSELYAIAGPFCTTILQGFTDVLGVDPCNPTSEQPGQNPMCPICLEGMEATLPDAILPTGQTCAQADEAGKAGNISEDQCAQIRAAQPVVDGICGCMVVGVDTDVPSFSPTGPPTTDPPTTSLPTTDPPTTEPPTTDPPTTEPPTSLPPTDNTSSAFGGNRAFTVGCGVLTVLFVTLM